MNKFAPFIERIFSTFERLNIPYVILRNYEGLPYELRSNDIDICVPLKEVRRAIKEILRLAKLNEFDYYFFTSCKSTYFIKLISLSKGCLKIDIVVGYENRGRVIFTASELINTKVRYGTLYVLDPVYEVSVVTVQAILTGGVLKRKYWDKLYEVFLNNESELGKVLKKAVGGWASNYILGILREGNEEKLYKSRRILQASTFLYAFRKSPFIFLHNYFLHYLKEFSKYFEINRRYTVAILGPDGSGKTTFVEVLKKKIEDKLKINQVSIKIFHFRPNVFPNLANIFRIQTKNQNGLEIPYQKPPAGFISSLMRIAYYSLDYIIGYCIKVVPHFKNYPFIIFDRYAHEFLCDPCRSRINLPLFVRKAFFAIIPKPRWTFVLKADADTILQRKKELSKEKVEELNENYAMLSRYKNVYFLDALDTPADIAERAFQIIIDDIGVRL
ncbi:MAG: hypothetical protein WBI96_04350 [Candidatus Hydrothermia bacterium]